MPIFFLDNTLPKQTPAFIFTQNQSDYFSLPFARILALPLRILVVSLVKCSLPCTPLINAVVALCGSFVAFQAVFGLFHRASSLRAYPHDVIGDGIHLYRDRL